MIPSCDVICELCSARVSQWFMGPTQVYIYRWTCRDCTRRWLPDGHKGIGFCDDYGAAAWSRTPGKDFDQFFAMVERKDPRDAEDLRLISRGRGWKVSYNRIEQLIEKGFLNSTGTRLTLKGKARIL